MYAALDDHVVMDSINSNSGRSFRAVVLFVGNVSKNLWKSSILVLNYEMGSGVLA